MAGRLILFSGAGISADSGISTFRDSDGLWENHAIDQVCREDTWRRNFELVHRFYNDRREGLRDVQPNRAHHVVASLSKDFETVNLTQNIDDLFERAGCKSVVHVHGRLTEMQCTACGHVFDIGYTRWSTEVDRCQKMRGMKACGCKRGVRPNVVFFRGQAPNYPVMFDTFETLTAEDVVVVCGTSSVVVDIEALLFDRPGTKIYSNVTVPKSSCCYDHVVLGRASETFDEVERIVRSVL